MTASDIVRLKILNDMLSNMSEDDRRNYIQLVKNKDHQEVMSALADQRSLINNIAKRVERQSWYIDFGSDLLANFTTDSLIWLGRKLFKR